MKLFPKNKANWSSAWISLYAIIIIPNKNVKWKQNKMQKKLRFSTHTTTHVFFLLFFSMCVFLVGFFFIIFGFLVFFLKQSPKKIIRIDCARAHSVIAQNYSHQNRVCLFSVECVSVCVAECVFYCSTN